MHPPERVEEVLALGRDGRSDSEISRLTGLPRATVRDWTAGRTPRRVTPRCSHDAEGLLPDSDGRARTCERLDLAWTSAGHHTIYVSRQADVARMDRFVGPKS